MLKNLVKIALFSILLLVFTTSQAQCAMCRAVLESEADTSIAEGVNNGIVYLMAIPYILVGGIAFFLYKKYARS
jgi:hypothetical protein